MNPPEGSTVTVGPPSGFSSETDPLGGSTVTVHPSSGSVSSTADGREGERQKEHAPFNVQRRKEVKQPLCNVYVYHVCVPLSMYRRPEGRDDVTHFCVQYSTIVQWTVGRSGWEAGGSVRWAQGRHPPAVPDWAAADRMCRWDGSVVRSSDLSSV